MKLKNWKDKLTFLAVMASALLFVAAILIYLATGWPIKGDESNSKLPCYSYMDGKQVQLPSEACE